MRQSNASAVATPQAELHAVTRADELIKSEGRAALLKALADLMAEGDASQRQPWDITMPAGLDSARLAQPFNEPLDGVAMREVAEPSVFRRFFGR